jgi:pimeloyl-ACP methyl ester carboxylesterase
MRHLIRIVCAAAALATGSVIAQTGSAERFPVPGGELALEQTGDGPVVVLLHGAFMDRGMWDKQVPALARQFRVIRYDIRPFGQSSPVTQPYAPIDDLRAILDRFGVRRAHLIGHSFGGNVAIDFAIAYPDRVASLALVGAAPAGLAAWGDEEREAAAAVFAAIEEGDDAVVRAWIAQPMWRASAARPEVVNELDAITRRSLAVFRMSTAPFTQMSAVTDNVAAIRAPMLVVYGDRDSASIREAGDRLAASVPGAVKQVVPGADHALPIGWASELNSVVLSFLTSLSRD